MFHQKRADLGLLANRMQSASSGQVQLDREERTMRRVVVGDHHAAVGQDAEAGEIEADVVARARGRVEVALSEVGQGVRFEVSETPRTCHSMSTSGPAASSSAR